METLILANTLFSNWPKTALFFLLYSFQFKSFFLLAPTAALIVIVIVVYYISNPLFQIFTQSLRAIDVTSVTLSRLNSNNAVDAKRCWLNVECSNVQMFQCSNDPMFQCSNLQMFQCPKVRIFKCASVQMLNFSNVQMVRCSIEQMFKCSNVQMIKC